MTAAILETIKVLFKALVGAFNLIPGWVWAILLTASVLGSCGLDRKWHNAEAAAAKATSTLVQERQDAKDALGEATEHVHVLEDALRHDHDLQEKKDAETRTTIDGLREDLRRNSRASGGRGLRDPWAEACPRGAAAGATATGADDRAADGAEAGRVLSAQLEGLLLTLAFDGDAINAAYASCRADALSLRERFNQLSPSPGPASTGSP